MSCKMVHILDLTGSFLTMFNLFALSAHPLFFWDKSGKYFLRFVPCLGFAYGAFGHA